MGAVADGVLNGGGIVGVIPDFLDQKKSLTMD
jgi:predicted Rossmann-fold nucleotide-binding protein